MVSGSPASIMKWLMGSSALCMSNLVDAVTSYSLPNGVLVEVKSIVTTVLGSTVVMKCSVSKIIIMVCTGFCLPWAEFTMHCQVLVCLTVIDKQWSVHLRYQDKLYNVHHSNVLHYSRALHLFNRNIILCLKGVRLEGFHCSILCHKDLGRMVYT